MDRTTLRRDALKYLIAAAVVSTMAFVAVVFGAKPPAREPSGVARVNTPAADEASRPFVLELPCWEKDGAVAQPPAGTRFVRLVGRVCGRVVDADAVTVTNETNHYLATIFPTGARLTTDLIELAPGANDLQIAIAREGEREIRHLALSR